MFQLIKIFRYRVSNSLFLKVCSRKLVSELRKFSVKIFVNSYKYIINSKNFLMYIFKRYNIKEIKNEVNGKNQINVILRIDMDVICN